MLQYCLGHASTESLFKFGSSLYGSNSESWAKYGYHTRRICMSTKSAPRRNTMLIIMDGFGVNPSKKHNAVVEANTPKLDEYLVKTRTLRSASGRAVGLPEGQMCNSEVGHLTRWLRSLSSNKIWCAWCGA